MSKENSRLKYIVLETPSKLPIHAAIKLEKLWYEKIQRENCVLILKLLNKTFCSFPKERKIKREKIILTSKNMYTV